MNEIDWSKAPEGADSLKINNAGVIRFFNGNLKYDPERGYNDGFNNYSEWKTIATRPTERKTVKDAVKTVLTGFNGDCLYYSPSRVTWYGTSEGKPGDAYAVCTRVEFEAEVERQKAYADGVPVQIKNGDAVYNLSNTSDNKLVYVKQKPTITKAQAWDLALRGYSAPSLADKYDIT